MADGIATLIIVLADVIAKWQMEWPLQGWSIGRCYCHVADGIATGSYHLSLSSEVYFVLPGFHFFKMLIILFFLVRYAFMVTSTAVCHRLTNNPHLDCPSIQPLWGVPEPSQRLG